MARLGVNRQPRGKLDPSDLVQETFLEAHRDFGQFAGKTEAELVVWLRQILARNLADQVRRYKGAQRRDVRLEGRLDFRVGRDVGSLIHHCGQGTHKHLMNEPIPGS